MDIDYKPILISFTMTKIDIDMILCKDTIKGTIKEENVHISLKPLI